MFKNWLPSNKFKIKNFYKITNKEKEPKREVKKKEKEDLSVEGGGWRRKRWK